MHTEDELWCGYECSSDRCFGWVFRMGSTVQARNNGVDNIKGILRKDCGGTTGPVKDARVRCKQKYKCWCGYMCMTDECSRAQLVKGI